MKKIDTPNKDPFKLLDEWMNSAKSSEPEDPSAACLATIGADGKPAARMVLLRGWGAYGVWFNTNEESRKGQDMAANPVAALCIHWKSLRRQIRIEGAIKMMNSTDTDAYFASRLRGSQIGAWASQQSRPLESMEALRAQVDAVEAEYVGRDIPRPEHWRGYIVVPERIEFWHQGDFRLHDRFVYELGQNKQWGCQRLYP